MTETLSIYPPKPAAAQQDIIKPSKRFKKEVVSMLAALLLFVVTYVVLLLITLAVASGFLFLAYCLVALHVNTITIALAAALAASGALLVYFLIKFLFKKSTPVDDSDLIEIFDADQPQLFDFIRKVTAETGVAFPKHIYLTPEVNAGVFYDSPFWSMFLPVKKNLKIGLGLINSLNLSEFKAVLAHEFGHFSQRSMKFGSYVYNLNKVIHDMLYDNEKYNNTLDSWSNGYSLFKITAFININLIKGIQYILQKVYVLINKSHLRLSREMEFQADAISAYVSGSNQSVSCLRRIDLAQACYQELLDYWNSKLVEKKRAANFYDQHRELMRYYAKERNMEVDSLGLPQPHRILAEINHSRVSLNDQWSSHPTDVERERHLLSLNIDTAPVERSVWTLFNDAEKLQQKATDIVYAQVDVKDLDELDNEQFRQMYIGDVRSHSYDPYFKKYYDHRFIAVDLSIDTNDTKLLTVDALFCDDNCELPKRINGLQQDINTLNHAKNNSNITSFDMAGTKYTADKTDAVIADLEKELEEAQQQLKELDQSIYDTYHQLAVEKGCLDELRQRYQKLMDTQESYTNSVEFYERIRAEVAPCYTTLKFEEINNTLAQVSVTEKELRTRLADISLLDAYTESITAEQQETIDKYLSAPEWKYFDGNNYNNDNLDLLVKTIETYLQFYYRYLYNVKDQLLNFKLDLLNRN